MPRETESIDIRTIHTIPELVQLAQAVRASQRPCLLTLDTEPLVMVEPVKGQKALRGRGMTQDDPFFSIIGIGRSEGSTDVSSNKRRYLAEAYATKQV